MNAEIKARDRFTGAFAPAGTAGTGAVVCYVGIFTRDHWLSLAGSPWLKAQSCFVEKEVAWAGNVVAKTGLDWLQVGQCPSRAERAGQVFEQRGDALWLLDAVTGKETPVPSSASAGADASCAASKHSSLDDLPGSEDDVDALVPLCEKFDRARFLEEGRHEAAVAIRSRLDVATCGNISSPVWSLYGLLGYEGMMVLPLKHEQLAIYAAKRILWNTKQRISMISALGADAVWIEECLTDQISPEIFRRVNVPILKKCISEIHALGMKSIYYYCGNPWDRMDAILETGADALHFEEGKKGFHINIEDVAARVDGRCVLFGNLDSIAVLQNGSEAALRLEIQRQLRAGARNGRRFVMSTGSPVTPNTPVERIRLYTDIVGELAGR